MQANLSLVFNYTGMQGLYKCWYLSSFQWVVYVIMMYAIMKSVVFIIFTL